MPIQDDAPPPFTVPPAYTGENKELHTELERRGNEVLDVLKGADDNVKLAVMSLLLIDLTMFQNGMDIGGIVGGFTNDAVAMMQLREPPK